jgi:hypothetical protein
MLSSLKIPAFPLKNKDISKRPQTFGRCMWQNGNPFRDVNSAWLADQIFKTHKKTV